MSVDPGGRFRGGRPAPAPPEVGGAADLARAGVADTARGRQLLDEIAQRLGPDLDALGCVSNPRLATL